VFLRHDKTKDVDRTRFRVGPQSDAAKIKSVSGCNSARRFGESWCLRLAFPPKKQAELAQRSDISEDANLQDMRSHTVADTWRDELIHNSTMKMEVSGFPKISYSKNIPRWQKYLASSAMNWNLEQIAGVWKQKRCKKIFGVKRNKFLNGYWTKPCNEGLKIYAFH
jgi:hypothetical protein